MYLKLRVNTMNENQEILYLLDNANHSPKKHRSYLKLSMDINHKGDERDCRHCTENDLCIPLAPAVKVGNGDLAKY